MKREGIRQLFVFGGSSNRVMGKCDWCTPTKRSKSTFLVVEMSPNMSWGNMTMVRCMDDQRWVVHLVRVNDFRRVAETKNETLSFSWSGGHHPCYDQRKHSGA